MDADKKRVCPVEKAGSLDNRLRRWFQNPRKILRPYIKEGMTVLDFGCGPGYFTLDMAQMVGNSGRVIAADLQEGMLGKLQQKIDKTELESRINLHKCEENRIGLNEKVDFVLAFYVLHEIPDQGLFFKEIAGILRPGGHILVVEPPFHVSKADFADTIAKAGEAGLKQIMGPKVLFNRTIIFIKS